MSSELPVIRDVRLSKLLLREPLRASSCSEYAKITGISITSILSMLEIYIHNEDIILETTRDDVYLRINNCLGKCHHRHNYFPPNIWSLVRSNNSLEEAERYYKIFKTLKFMGWQVEGNNKKIPTDRNHQRPLFGLTIHNLTIPLVIFPPYRELAQRDSILSRFLKINNNLVALLIPEDTLEKYIAHIRAWMKTNNVTDFDILLLEAPTFNPIVISTADGSLEPRMVSITNLPERYT
jgi:hypothetical protein